MDRNGPPSEPAGGAPPLVREEGPLATGERLRPFALAALTVALLALCALLTYPFLPAVTWGAALAIIAWPLQARLLRRFPQRPTAAAVLTSAVVIVLVVVPCVLVAYQLALEATSASDRARAEQMDGTVRGQLARTPGFDGVVAWADRVNVDIDAGVRSVVQSTLGDAAALTRGSLGALFQAAIAVFVLFYLLRDRAVLVAALRRIMPMTRAEADRVFESAAGSVHANLYANLLTSAINGSVGGLLFWFIGLPSPVLWGVVLFVLGMLPVVGIPLVWIPAATYLGLTGNWPAAAALVAWGVGSAVLVDTLLYTRLAGDRMRLHPVPTMLAYIGGLAVFGASGMVLGPGVLAVTVAVLEVWHRRAAGAEVARVVTDAPPEPAVPAAAYPAPRPQLTPS